MGTLLLLLACAKPLVTESPTNGDQDWAGVWVVEWLRPGWRPPLFIGKLTVEPGIDGEGQVALEFEQTTGSFVPVSQRLESDSARLVFAPEGAPTSKVALDLFRDGDDIHGIAQWTKEERVSIPWSDVVGSRAWDALPVAAEEEPWPRATPQEVGLDPELVEQLVYTAQLTHSSGIVLVKDDRLIVSAGGDQDQPTNVTSVSKAVSSLAVPHLIADGHWPGIDEPLSTAFPEWAEDARGDITMREVLSHTTGLETPPYREWLDAGGHDLRSDLLGAALREPHSKAFEYSNRGVELTSVLVWTLTGQSLADYLDSRLNEPTAAGLTWGRDDPKPLTRRSGAALLWPASRCWRGRCPRARSTGRSWHGL